MYKYKSFFVVEPEFCSKNKSQIIKTGEAGDAIKLNWKILRSERNPSNQSARDKVPIVYFPQIKCWS